MMIKTSLLRSVPAPVEKRRALFAGVLFRMYTMYAESHHFKTEVLVSK